MRTAGWRGFVAGSARRRAGIALAIVLGVASVASAAVEGAALPGAPRKLTAHLNGTLLTLSWQPPETGSFDGYRVEAGIAPGTTVSQGDVGLVTRLPPIPMPPGTFFLRVRARQGDLVGPPSNEVVVTVASCTTAPGAPRNLRASVVADTVSLRWDPPSSGGAPGAYLLELGRAPGSSDVAVADVGAARAVPPFSLPAATYYARTRAYNGCGSGPASNEVKFTVGAAPPSSAAWGIAIDSRTLRQYCGSSQPATFTMVVDGVTQTLQMAPGGSSSVSGFRPVAAEVPRQIFTNIQTGCGSASGPSTTQFGKYCVLYILCAGDHPGDPYPPTWFTVRGNLETCTRPSDADLEQICRSPGD